MMEGDAGKEVGMKQSRCKPEGDGHLDRLGEGHGKVKVASVSSGSPGRSSGPSESCGSSSQSSLESASSVRDWKYKLRDVISTWRQTVQKWNEKVEKKSNVSFMTTLDREVFPSHVPPTRFGNDLTPIRGEPNRGPGCYDNEEYSNFWYGVKTRITSKKGYSLGARTGPRMAREQVFKTPAAPTYQTKCTEPIVFDEAYKPFDAAAKRFPVFRRDIEDITPGAGTYEHGIKRDRKVQWHQSFGGAPINLPAVGQQSTISKNTEKLLGTREEKKYHRKLAYLKLYYE